MSISTIMWICVGVSVVFCAAYFLISSNKERLAIEEQAKKLCADMQVAYPQPRKQIDSIEVDEKCVKVTVKDGADAAENTYDLCSYNISSSGETTMSAVANYIADCFADLEWKRTIDKAEENNTVIMKGVVLKNITRLGYTEMKK